MGRVSLLGTIGDSQTPTACGPPENFSLRVTLELIFQRISEADELENLFGEGQEIEKRNFRH